jgi:uncharacterized delta-60 repeat protein
LYVNPKSTGDLSDAATNSVKPNGQTRYLRAREFKKHNAWKLRRILWLALCLNFLSACAPLNFAQGGIPLWTNRYNGPTGRAEWALATAVDGGGNVFVTGSSSNGTNDDYATLKFSSAGVPLWTNRYNGPANYHDGTLAMALDSSGNVFVAGYSYGSSGSSDYATIAYSSAGVPLWTNRYDGRANYADGATGIAVDSAGNVFVTGYSGNNSFDYDYTTIAYSSAGVALWTNRYDGPANAYDKAVAIAVDTRGNVFVTGYSYGSSGHSDYATIAYSSAGVALWTNRYSGSNTNEYATDIAIDSNGNVFVTGHSYGGSGNYDYATIAYSRTGVPLWTNRYNGPANTHDYASDAAVDTSGNVFVTGNSGRPTASDYATIAYSSAGVPFWTNRYNGPANSWDEAYSVAVDSSGNVFVTGSSRGSSNNYDYATIAYSRAGVPLWTNRHNGPGNWEEAYAVTVDSDGNVFVTGRSIGSSGSLEYATIKYTSSVLPRLSIQPNSTGGWIIQHAGVPGSPCRLQRATALTGPWSDLATNTPSAAGLIDFHEISPPPAGAFYRTMQP